MLIIFSAKNREEKINHNNKQLIFKVRFNLFTQAFRFWNVVIKNNISYVFHNQGSALNLISNVWLKISIGIILSKLNESWKIGNK